MGARGHQRRGARAVISLLTPFIGRCFDLVGTACGDDRRTANPLLREVAQGVIVALMAGTAGEREAKALLPGAPFFEHVRRRTEDANEPRRMEHIGEAGDAAVAAASERLGALIGEQASPLAAPPARGERYDTPAHGRLVKSVILDGRPWYGVWDTIKAAKLRPIEGMRIRRALQPEEMRMERIGIAPGSRSMVLISMPAFISIAIQGSDASRPGSEGNALRRRVLSDAVEAWAAESARLNARASSKALIAATGSTAIARRSDKDQEESKAALATTAVEIEARDRTIEARDRRIEALRTRLEIEETASAAAERRAAQATRHGRHERAVVEGLLAEAHSLERATMERAKETAAKAAAGEAATAALEDEIAILRETIARIGRTIADVDKRR